MYSVVHFYQEDTIEGVPSNWITKLGNEQFCYWPGKNGVTSLIKRCVPYNKSWELVKCIVKYTADSYEDMREKCKLAVYSTAAENSDEEQHRVISSESDDVQIPSPPTKRKKVFSQDQLPSSNKSAKSMTRSATVISTDSDEVDIPPSPPIKKRKVSSNEPSTSCGRSSKVTVTTEKNTSLVLVVKALDEKVGRLEDKIDEIVLSMAEIEKDGKNFMIKLNVA